jgi:hypothetical protein
MDREHATANSWKCEPIPMTKTAIAYERVFCPAEYAALVFGFIPEVMEDKWFIYLEDDILYFHRSWTGYCIFQVFLEVRNDGYAVRETWVSRDPEQYRNTDPAYDRQTLDCLIDHFLLGKDDVPSPVYRSAD